MQTGAWKIDCIITWFVTWNVRHHKSYCTIEIFAQFHFQAAVKRFHNVFFFFFKPEKT